MRPTLFAASLALMASGCTTLATHGVMDKASSEALGEFHAFAQICNEVGAYGDDTMQLHQGVVEDFLDLSTYNKEALEEAQNRVYEIYFSSNKEDVHKECVGKRNDTADAYIMLNERLNLLRVARTQSWVNLAGRLVSVGL